MKNEPESWQAVSYLEVVESETFFIEPMGYEDLGAPGNLGSLKGDATGVVISPIFCYKIQIMTMTDLTV
jgi:hypothetical protein